MHDYGRATRTWGSATVVMALAYVGGLKGSWMADDIMTDGGRRCVDNLVDLRTITLRMFRPTYATRSVHFRRIRFRHTRIPDPVIDHCDLPPVIGQRICGGRVKKKGGRVKRTKWEKKTAGRGKIEFERGKKKKKKKRKRDGEFETRRFQPLAN